MPVKISLKNFGDETIQTPEKQAAGQIAECFKLEFETDFKAAQGELLILSNLTLIGQEVKDIDLLIIGFLENFKLKIETKTKDSNGVITEVSNNLVEVKTFCYVIEIKDHTAERIKTDGPILSVKYKDHWHDATSQSEKQKYSLKNYLTDNLGVSPYICNFLWLRNISDEEYISLFDNTSTNIFANQFSFRNLIEKSTLQQIPYKPTSIDNCVINNISNQNKDSFDKSKVLAVFDLFEQTKQACGSITRQKLELLTKNVLENQIYIQNIGTKLTVLSGRAGTGKTVRLLQVATELTKLNENRCLILTYNHALVSDIRRVLAFAGIPDGFSTHSVQISTLHSYFIKLLTSFGVIQGGIESNNNFFEVYNQKIKEMLEYLNQGVIEQKDINDLMKKENDAVAWDYILIDEAQDWSENEKQILFKIYGIEHVIVADGVDQFIRNGNKQNWMKGLKVNVDYYHKSETKGLRQKFNIVNFVNAYASNSGLNWSVQPNSTFVGGKIIITTLPYSTEIHRRLFDDCISNGNAAYDMLFLTPPQLVKKNEDGKQYFSKIEVFKQNGIYLFDGTNTNLREKYPININECRLFQYDSCRGLEGWTVVCLHFDELIKYKLETWVDSTEEQMALETPEARKKRCVNLWSLMPLTRAIDTLVITLKDKNSDTATMLKKLAIKNEDIIEWLD